jgi:formylglycine-generating enzyme required for sulfatase activity
VPRLAIALVGSIGLGSIAALSATAAIPEPDHLFYGVVLESGSPRIGIPVELRLGDESGELLASGHSGGGVAGSTELYLLQVRVESPEILGEARTAGTARIGDAATLVVDGRPKAQLHVGGRGLFVRIDVDLGSGGVPAADDPDGDLDGDGIPNYLDNCTFSNPDQLDTNGNGVGDPCEGGIAFEASLVEVAADGTSGANPSDPATGFGAVDYSFQVADTEVSNAQYAEMLTAVASTSDPHGLFNPMMASDPRGGILRQGSPGAWSYSLKPNMANKPVNFVSWLDAARHSNWLFNGKPRGPPGPGTTESGAFDLGIENAGVAAVAEMVEGFSLPTEHEWYKTAYYDPAIGEYWTYPTRSDSEPLPALATGAGDVANPGPERVNFGSNADWNGVDGHVTSVGSAGATSAYGALDMAGNVWEWTAADSESDLRVVRGGSYRDDRFALEAEADGDRSQLLRDPGYEGPEVGFRVAVIPTVVPEPGFGLLLAAGSAGLVGLGRRARRASQSRVATEPRSPDFFAALAARFAARSSRRAGSKIQATATPSR